jgi:phage gp36-like protein
MFIEIEELKSVMYNYQLTQIVENDTDIVVMAISAAMEEIRSYLSVRFDCDAIFAATGTDRNALIVEMMKNIAAWHVVRLSNVDIIYEKLKDRYDRAINWLDRVASGLLVPSLPIKQDENGGTQTRFRSGSNPKFNHSF